MVRCCHLLKLNCTELNNGLCSALPSRTVVISSFICHTLSVLIIEDTNYCVFILYVFPVSCTQKWSMSMWYSAAVFAVDARKCGFYCILHYAQHVLIIHMSSVLNYIEKKVAHRKKHDVYIINCSMLFPELAKCFYTCIVVFTYSILWTVSTMLTPAECMTVLCCLHHNTTQPRASH